MNNNGLFSKDIEKGMRRSHSEPCIIKVSNQDFSYLFLPNPNQERKTHSKHDYICLSIVCFGYGKDRKPYESPVCLPDNTFLLISIIVVSCTIGMFFLKCDFNSPTP